MFPKLERNHWLQCVVDTQDFHKPFCLLSQERFRPRPRSEVYPQLSCGLHSINKRQGTKIWSNAQRMVIKKWHESRKKRRHPKTKTAVFPCFVSSLLMIIILGGWSPTATLTTRNFKVPKTWTQTPISIAIHLRLFLFPNTSLHFYCLTKLLVNHDTKGVYVWFWSRTQTI